MDDEDIWDDTFLVDSWNEALEEYKKYHSIHRNGGAVQSANGVPNVSRTGRDSNSEPREQDQAMEEEEGEVASLEPWNDPFNNSTPDSTLKDKSAPGGHAAVERGSSPKVSSSAGHGRGGPILQTLLGTVQDDGLKELLMSWYYAGYYTGLYQGRQQKKQEAER